MTAKELKRLRRTDLLELLLELSRENDRLKQELEQAKGQLEDRRVRLERSGSLAEAALSLGGVFEAAERACELYKENIRCELQERCSTCPVWIELFEPEQTEQEETGE